MRLRPVSRGRLAAAAGLGLSLALVTLLPQTPGVSSTAAASATDPGSLGTATTASAAPAVSPALQSYYDQEVTWGDCDAGESGNDGGDAGFECATLTVPLDYSQPDGQTITLALKRLPASDGKAEDGSLFLNPGGPGGSGIDMVSDASQLLTQQALAAYDVIGFDPRGVGDSSPLTCWSEPGGQAGPPAGTAEPSAPTGTASGPEGTSEAGSAASTQVPGSSPRPTEGAAATPASRFVAMGRTLAAACEENTPVPELLDNMDAVTVAQDIDVMRGVVGDSRLNYLGISYGTYLGAVYAERFPGSVGRMVLDSAMDPSMERAQVHADNMAHLESALHSYVDYCLAGDGCPLTGTREEALTQLDTFLTGLDTEPLPVDGEETTYNRTDALGVIQFFTTRQQGYWPYLTEGLTQAISEHDATTLAANQRIVAEQTGIAGVADQPGQEPDQQPVTAEEAADLRNEQAAFNAIHCSDYPDTGEEATWDSQATSLKESSPFSYSESEAYTDAFCHGWGHSSGARRPAAVRAPGSQPILVVGVHDDSQTPYPWAVFLADQLEPGHLLSVDEALHGAVGQNSCTTRAVSEFLVSGTLPGDGAVCQADPVPAAEEQ